ncbi:MAG: hypothetical protein H6733_09925 [Alphaproteobacteria bacterium]|nr:hypothetical protein [Alphaproteobacteria bacterium]
MTSPRSHRVPPALGLGALLACAPAWAGEDVAHEPETPETPEHGVDAHAARHEAIEADERYAKEHPNVLAVRVLSSAVYDADGPRGRWGLGAVWERELVPRWLELELGVNGLAGRQDGTLAMDLLLKKPIPLAPSWELHTGVGGTIAAVWPYDRTELEPRGEEVGGLPLLEGGLVGTFGFFAWPGRHVGLLVEVNGKLLWGEEGLIGETEIAGGIAFRF